MSAIDWLLESDPSIRWQVMRDVLGAPEHEWRLERARVETEGWGARLLALEDEDGQWAGGSFVPRGFEPHDWQEEGQPWTATTHVLGRLWGPALARAGGPARRALALTAATSRGTRAAQPFWEGEV